MNPLFALAVAPGLAICLYIYYKDHYEPEPVSILISCFLLGVLGILPAMLIEFISQQLGFSENSPSFLVVLIFAFLVVGGTEEGSKFFFLRYYAFRQKSFSEPFDGIIYSVMIGMGFATAENIIYVLHGGVEVAILRMFLSVPAHATFAVLMGYYAGLAKFNPSRRSQLLFYGLLLAILFHGSFDFFLFLGHSSLISIGALGSLFVAARLSRRAIRKGQELSADMHITPEKQEEKP